MNVIPNNGTVAINNAPTINKSEMDAMLASIPVQQIIKDSMPKLENAIHESIANERAAREPLPSIVHDAFTNEPKVISLSTGDVTIRPMVAYDVNLFKLIGSPFYQLMMGDLDKSVLQQEGLFADEEQSYELIYQFINPIAKVYKTFKQGREVFKDTVLQEIGFKFTLADASLAVNAIMLHIFNVELARNNFEIGSNGEEDKKKLKLEVLPS